MRRSKFKVGDRVRYVGTKSGGTATKGKEYTILSVNLPWFRIENDHGRADGWAEDQFELVNTFGPVRTVTRKEIVDGEFGRIRVLSLTGVSDKRVGLRFTSPDGAQLASLDAPELTAAIETLTTIRDALVQHG